jgi:hypothetical protein
MDLEFHYYLTALVALRAGFTSDETAVLAYATQYTDDNTAVFAINKGAEGAYSNYISQTSNILKAEKELMQIYPIFHFVPGNKEEIESDCALRRDGKFHVLNTIPDNGNARVLFKAALETKNIYRIGIAAHMFADTFAHQNFVGYYESFNAMKGLLDKAIPDVGHADAKHDPDLPGLVWNDVRLTRKNTEVSNKERFLAAAGRLFEEFRLYKDPACPQETLARDKASVLSEIDAAIGSTGDHSRNGAEKERRMAAYRSLLNGGIPEYDKRAWFDEAVARKGILAPLGIWATYEWKPDYQDSHWFKFQEAVKNHQWFTKDNVLGKITDKLELDRFNN